MKHLLVLFLLLTSSVSQAWEQRNPLPQNSCKLHAPWGFPNAEGITPICRQAYYVGYDPLAKIPKFVTTEVTPGHVLGCVERSNAFAADASVKDGPTPKDYVGSGFDKGHQVPDGELSWDPQVEHESFLMTNMAPQAGSLNRGIWKLLETAVRSWVDDLRQPFVVFTGSVYNSRDKKIGRGVVVPHAFYKVVVNEVTLEYAAWEFPHVSPYPNLGNDLKKFRTSVEKIQKESGVIFCLPIGAKELPVGKEWKTNFGKLSKNKSQTCDIKK